MIQIKLKDGSVFNIDEPTVNIETTATGMAIFCFRDNAGSPFLTVPINNIDRIVACENIDLKGRDKIFTLTKEIKK